MKLKLFSFKDEEDDELLKEYENDLLDGGSDYDSDNDDDDYEDHSRRHD